AGSPACPRPSPPPGRLRDGFARTGRRASRTAATSTPTTTSGTASLSSSWIRRWPTRAPSSSPETTWRPRRCASSTASATGWGGLAIHAARRSGCRVTTTTISQEQCEYSRARVAAAGLSDLITVLDQNYRDLKGTYSKLVSVEMIEAVDWRLY